MQKKSLSERLNQKGNTHDESCPIAQEHVEFLRDQPTLANTNMPVATLIIHDDTHTCHTTTCDPQVPPHEWRGIATIQIHGHAPELPLLRLGPERSSVENLFPLLLIQVSDPQ